MPRAALNRRLTWTLASLGLLLGLAIAGCASERPSVRPPQLTMDQISELYIKQALALGEHDPNLVDAYYGPKDWQAQAKTRKRTLIEIRNVLVRLYQDIDSAPTDTSVQPELWNLRRRHLRNQIAALEARTRMLEGWKPSFDDESLALYDISAPFYGQEDFKPMLASLDRMLPRGGGTLTERYNRYLERFTVPPNRVEEVMRIAIGAARERTLQYFRLPEGERFELALVKDKPWSAYNWYQGDFVSRIEINTDQPLTVARALELAAHEGYPGHHVFNVLIEDQLVRGRGWKEFTLYPLFSPQSFIAEGTADYGIELAFPRAARVALIKKLMAVSGLNPGEAETYDAVVQATKLSGAATVEAARRYRDGQADAAQTLDWLQTYGLATPERAQQRLDFFDRYGAYIINYAFGEAVVGGYVQRSVGESEPDYARWRALFDLLTTPRTPQMLMAE